MSSIARVFTLGLVILCAHGAMTARAGEPTPTPAAVPAQGAVPPEGWIWDKLPYPAMVLESFATFPEADLRAIVYTALPRLAIDDETVEAAVAEDIALLLRASVAIQLLEVQDHMDADLRVVARTFAFYLERVGRAYVEDDAVRDTFERLPSLVPEGSRQVAAALGKSLAGARAYASGWFPRAFALEAPVASLGVVAWSQFALIAHGAGRFEEAAAAFSQALALKPPLQVLINAYAMMVDWNTKESLGVAEMIRTQVLAEEPRLVTRFTNVDGRFADARAVKEFRSKRPELTPEATIAMGQTLMRTGDRDGAEALAREALGRYKDNQTIWYMAAGILQQNGRHDSLKILYKDAETAGRLDTRLREFRLTALIDAHITAGFGGVAPLRDDALLTSELAWLASRGPHESFSASVGEFLMELAAYTVLKPDDPASAAAAASINKRALAIAEAHKSVPDAWRLAMAGAVTAGFLASGEISILKKIPRGGGAEMAAVRAVGARLEAAYAMRARDSKRMVASSKSLASSDKELARLAKVATAKDRPDLDRELAMNAVMGANLEAMRVTVPPTGAGALKEADKKRWLSAVAALGGRLAEFDLSFEQGRRFAQAVHTSTAAILAGLGDQEGAVTALRAMRRLNVSPFLSNLAASYLMERRKILGDAVDFMGRALGSDEGMHAEQYANLRLSQLYTALGQGEDAAAAGGAALSKWDAAGLPAKVAEGTLRALIVSELGVSLSIDGDKPLGLVLMFEPVVALVPEAAADRTALKSAQPKPAPTP